MIGVLYRSTKLLVHGKGGMKMYDIILKALIIIVSNFLFLLVWVSPCYCYEEKERNEYYEYISSFWKNINSLAQYNLKSYVPIWFNDKKQDRLYLVFDEKYRFSTEYEIIGYVREEPPASKDQAKYNLSVESTKEEILKILPAKKIENQIDWAEIKEHWNSSKVHVGVTKEEIFNLLSVRKSKNKTQQLVALDNHSGHFIYVFIGDLFFEGEKEKISDICSKYELVFYNLKPDCIETSKRLKELANIYSQRSISNNDFSLLESCMMPITGTRVRWSCGAPLGLYKNSRESANTEYQVNKQMLQYGRKLKETLFFDIGVYDLINNKTPDKFIEGYNYNIVKYLYDNKQVKTDHFDRENFFHISAKLEKIYPFICIGFIVFSILINLYAKYLKLRFSFLWLLTFALAQATFFAPLPNPFVGIVFMYMGHIVITSVLQIAIVKQLNPYVMIYLFIFALYWATLHHLIIKKIIRKIYE
jgi:hypothetical protein